MLPYQEQYLENARQISDNIGPPEATDGDYSAWRARFRERESMLARLRQENIDLLNEYLFPELDRLHSAGQDELTDLEEFAEALVAGSRKPDCGLSMIVHEAVLKAYRLRRDRTGIIRELYRLGMATYYQYRVLRGLPHPLVKSYHFQNEMVFTEAGSYLKYFENLPDEETKGYVIRSLANISICSLDYKKRVAISSRILQIVQDPYYISLAPGLPWSRFLLATNQQMSANRQVLSRGSLSPEELAKIFDSCHAVFRPETLSENPNPRWLWPYYEMEFTCGFVGLPATLQRMEQLIESGQWNEFDVSGMYANIQLPIYYGKLLSQNPSYLEKPLYRSRLRDYYAQMMSYLRAIPANPNDENLSYQLCLLLSDYQEIDETLPFKEILAEILRKFYPRLFLRGRKAGRMLALLCGAVTESEPSFFDDLPVLSDTDAETKKATLEAYALSCGLLYDIGLCFMGTERITVGRTVFEEEEKIIGLHAECGYDLLQGKRSTAAFADVARGHHAAYVESGSPSDGYVRSRSAFRKIVDAAATVDYCLSNPFDAEEDLFRTILETENSRFSPRIAAYYSDRALQDAFWAILHEENEADLRDVFDSLKKPVPGEAAAAE